MRESFPQVEGVCFNRVANLTVDFVGLSAAFSAEQASSDLGVACWTNNYVVVDRFNGGRRHHTHRQERK